jgi:hypothetical protein
VVKKPSPQKVAEPKPAPPKPAVAAPYSFDLLDAVTPQFDSSKIPDDIFTMPAQ